MAKPITQKLIQENKRLQSIEIQMVTFLGGATMNAEDVKASFDGIASQETINSIAEKSLYLYFDKNKNEISSAHSADITYDFSYDAGASNIKLAIADKIGMVGTNQVVFGAKLTGSDYSLSIKVEGKNVGYWNLHIKKIQVTDADDTHDRILDATNPLKKSGSWRAKYDTKRT